jgi:filamentous hemagglutinin
VGVAIAGALGGPVKGAVAVLADQAVQAAAGEEIEAFEEALTNEMGTAITRPDESTEEFSANVADDPDGSDALIQDGSRFVLGTVIGIVSGKKFAGSKKGEGDNRNDQETENEQFTGGPHRETSQPAGEGLDSHHCPAKSCYKDAQISSQDGPAVKLDPPDHRRTASYGSSPDAKEYRALQKELVDQGRVREAVQMDIDDLRRKFGDKYESAIKQMQTYLDTLDPEDFVNK